MSGSLLDTSVLALAHRAPSGAEIHAFVEGHWGCGAIASLTLHEVLFGASRLPCGRRRAQFER